MLLPSSKSSWHSTKVWLKSRLMTPALYICRVLKHADASLNTLPSVWLQQLLCRVSEPGQSRDDIIRRSAGLPPAFMSIFLAEPQGTHKHLLHIGLSGLLVIAGLSSVHALLSKIMMIVSVDLWLSPSTIRDQEAALIMQANRRRESLGHVCIP